MQTQQAEHRQGKHRHNKPAGKPETEPAADTKEPATDKPVEGPRAELRTDIVIAFQVIIPHGHTIADVTKPTYWKSVAHQLRRPLCRFARMELIWEDASQEADLRLLSATEGAAQVRVINHRIYDEDGKAPVLPDGFSIVFIRESGWRVTSSDGQVIIEKQPTRGDAIKATARLRDRFGD